MKTKLLSLAFAAIVLSCLGHAQTFVAPPGLIYVNYTLVAPSGSCSSTSPMEQVIGAGTVWTCQSGTWAQISGGGGGTITGVTAGTGLSGGGTSGTVTVSCASPSASTVGCVESYAAVSNQWINAVSTGGVFSSSQPSCESLSDAGTGCNATIGNYVATTRTVNGHALSSNVTVSASDLTTGTLPAANGGVANIATANQGYFWSSGYTSPPLVAVFNQNPVVNQTANNVIAWQFVLHDAITVGHVGYNSASNWGSNHFSFAIYSADGTTKLIDTGAQSPASATAVTVTLGSTVTLNPGVYWFAQTADVTTSTLEVLCYGGTSTTAVATFALEYMNATTVHPKAIIAGNASTSGAMPGSLGTITTALPYGSGGTATTAMSWVGFEP